MKVIVLGGGVSGCAITRELTQYGHEVTLIEKNSYLGGGCHTFFWGGHPYTEGPRPLILRNDKIFNYINEIVSLRTFPLLLDTYIEQDQQFYSFPIHQDDIQIMPDREQILKELSERPTENNADNLEDGWINAVGPTLYKKYVKTYTEKMWEVDNNKVFPDYSWSVKGNPIQSGERTVELEKGKKAFAYPIEETGYNRFFEYCVKDAKVILGCKVTFVDLERKVVYFENEKIKGDMIVSTMALDDLMEKAYGELRYMGRDFYPIVFPVEHVFRDEHHFIYYPNQERYTRIVEYKNLTLHKSKDTLVVLEIPSHSNRLYAYNLPSEQKKAQQYLDALPPNVFSIGRLGTYKYLDIGQCFEVVWNLAESLS